MKYSVHRSVEVISTLLVVLTTLAFPALARAGGLKACKSPIPACGCAAKKAQRYFLAGSLNSTSTTVDCITVAKAGVVIDLNGNSLTGLGAGATNAGIHVLAAAGDAHIQGTRSSASISKFGNGILIDASNVAVTEIELTKNIQYGIEINGSNNAVYDLEAGKSNDNTSGNGIAGVFINNGSNNLVDDIQADYNDQYGVEVSGGANNAMHDIDGDSNGVYGIWIKGANGTRLVDSTGRFNGQDGVYIGCAPSGGVGGACGSAVTSSRVVVKIGQFSSNGATGIAVDSGNLANQIGNNVGASNGTFDADDANSTCGTNFWFLDAFGTTSKVCIR